MTEGKISVPLTPKEDVEREAMLELAARCEKASGPDHVLDAEIHCVVCGFTMHEDSDPSTGVFAFWDRGICHNCSSWSEITASLDAATTLVPEGCGYVLRHRIGKMPAAALEFGEGWPHIPQTIDGWGDYSSGNNDACALIAACLRALAKELPDA